MSYIGQQPLNNFVTKQSQTFSPDGSSTAFTLNFSVTSGVDIMLVINNVVQEPGAGKAYTASGTTLTMSEAPGASDSMYCIFLGLALQTVNPGDGSVGTSKLADSAITTAKLNSSLDLSSKTITLASNMKNTPNFSAVPSSTQTISTSTWTAVNFQTEIYDTASAYDGTNKFTVPTGQGGKYFFKANLSIDSVYDGDIIVGNLYKNGNADVGSENESIRTRHVVAKDNTTITFNLCGLVEASAGDYFQVYINHNRGSDRTLNSARCGFIGYKIIE